MKKDKSKILKVKQSPKPRSKIQNFYPLTYFRSVEELRCGARTIKDHPERKIKYLWDLIINLKADLEKDLSIMGQGIKGIVHPQVAIYNPENILIEEGAEVEAGAVLDARSGPIYIGKKTIIRSHSYLRGPLSIGPECRIGGEISNTIFHGYSNKAHYGFIGHSYIGEWVNLGAGTTNSNLKNNYSSVKIWVNGQMIDSGQQFLGCFIGDFARLGIGTLINTGTVIGVAANVFAGGMTGKFVPSFAWGEKQTVEIPKLAKTIKLMMSRRGKDSDQLEFRLQKIFLLSAQERFGNAQIA